MKELTKKQTEIYNQIKEFINKYGYSPTIRELCDLCGLSSSATMFIHLKKLRDKGAIDYEDGKSRTITIYKNKE